MVYQMLQGTGIYVLKKSQINQESSVVVLNRHYFFWHFKNELQGLLITHVDDFCWGGTKYFKQIVIEPLQKVFSVGTENGKIFKYLRLDIIQNKKI